MDLFKNKYRGCLFGHIENQNMHLNALGEIVTNEWLKSKYVRPEIDLDTFVVMPNHIHGIVIIKPDPVETHGRASLHPINRASLQRTPKSISSMIAGFKSACTSQINMLRNTPGTPIWQPRFHDRIIRNEQELMAVREYIQNNPINWYNDNEYT